MKVNYSPNQVLELFNGYPEKWWIAGGWAIDLFLGEQTREHEDVDIAILRKDEAVFRHRLNDWEIWPGFGNDKLESRPIESGEKLSNDREVLWCRPSSESEWAFEMLLNKSDGDSWVFKRNEYVRVLVDDIGFVSKEGLPYLRPEIVLLYKAKNLREKDQHDFNQVMPRLELDSRTWFRESLAIVHPEHSWLLEF